MKTIIKLAIAIAIANALFQVGRAYVSFFQFQDAVDEMVTHTTGTDAQVRDKVLELAAKFEEPVEADVIAIRREEHHTFVDATYSKDLKLFPGYVRKWPFTLKVDGYVIVPQKLTGESANP